MSKGVWFPNSTGKTELLNGLLLKPTHQCCQWNPKAVGLTWLALQFSQHGGCQIVREECSWLGNMAQAAVWEMRQQEWLPSNLEMGLRQWQLIVLQSMLCWRAQSRIQESFNSNNRDASATSAIKHSAFFVSGFQHIGPNQILVMLRAPNLSCKCKSFWVYFSLPDKQTRSHSKPIVNYIRFFSLKKATGEENVETWKQTINNGMASSTTPRPFACQKGIFHIQSIRKMRSERICSFASKTSTGINHPPKIK